MEDKRGPEEFKQSAERGSTRVFIRHAIQQCMNMKHVTGTGIQRELRV